MFFFEYLCCFDGAHSNIPCLANEESYEVAGSLGVVRYNCCSFGGPSTILTGNIFCVRVGVPPTPTWHHISTVVESKSIGETLVAAA